MTGFFDLSQKPFQRVKGYFEGEVRVSNVVEFPGAGLGRLITINSELNGAISTSEAATVTGRSSVNLSNKLYVLEARPASVAALEV